MTISDFAWFICSQPGAPDPYGLADLELVFLPDDFCPAMPAGGRGLLESVFGGESGYHVRISGYEDPQADPRDLRLGSMRAIVFNFIDAELCDFSGCAGLARLPVSPA